jgi:predicted metal-dependent hydrolase
MTTAALQQLPLWSDGAIDAAWRVRRSQRARRLGVRIFRDGTVEIVVPPGAGARAVSAFVARHRDWIERHRQRAPRADLAFPPERIDLPALGESWACHVVPAGAPGVRREPPVRALAASGTGGVLQLRSGTDESLLGNAMLDWLCERATAALAPQLSTLAHNCGVRYRRLQVRRQRTRWGSCSARGTISLNCCLLFHRPAVVRYLLVHELSHLTHMNHSARFWQQVERHDPQWREHDRELTAGWNQVPGWALCSLQARGATA